MIEPKLLRELASDYSRNGSLHASTALQRAADHIEALAAQVEEMREVLWTLTEHNKLHFGGAHNTVIEGTKALTLTPPASLALHDAGVLQRAYEQLGYMDHYDNYIIDGDELKEEIARIRAEAGREGE